MLSYLYFWSTHKYLFHWYVHVPEYEIPFFILQHKIHLLINVINYIRHLELNDMFAFFRVFFLMKYGLFMNLCTTVFLENTEIEKMKKHDFLCWSVIV